MIEVEDVEKSFRTVRALRRIQFSARDGEVTGLIGPNGAGKTTALRIIYTVLEPDGGRVRVDGMDTVERRRDVQKRIGVLPDSRGLYPRLTAREHIRYYGRLHGLNGAGLEARIDELIHLLDIGSSRAVHKMIAELRAEGRCVLFCSHIMQEVIDICDKIVVIADGEAVAEGTVDELLAQTGRDNIEESFLDLTGTREGW